MYPDYLPRSAAERDALEAMAERKLPTYALVGHARYDDRAGEPAVVLPFRHIAPKKSLDAVTAHFSEYVYGRTGERQRVARNGGPGERDIFKGVPRRYLHARGIMNYRIIELPSMIEVLEGVIEISREPACEHDPGILESYLSSLRDAA
jgi:hypothetical protein